MKEIMEQFRKHIEERAVDVSPVWRKLKPELHATIAQFMETYIADTNDVEGLDAINLGRLIDAMTHAAASEVTNTLTGRETGLDAFEEAVARRTKKEQEDTRCGERRK